MLRSLSNAPRRHVLRVAASALAAGVAAVAAVSLVTVPAEASPRVGPLARVSVDTAQADFDRLRVDFPTNASDAYQWTDRQGTMRLVMWTGDGGEGASQLGAVLVRETSGRATVLRRLRDFGTPSAGFLPNSVTLTDTDRDGRGEITVGWYLVGDPTRAGGPPPIATTKLVLLEGSRKYILRGKAWLTADEALRHGTGTAAKPVADPRRQSWPTGSLAHARQVYDRVTFRGAPGSGHGSRTVSSWPAWWRPTRRR